MASDLRIRRATGADRPRLAEIFLVVRRHAFPWIEAETFRLADFKRETEGETILLAEDDQAILGFASVWEPDAFLHHLYVDPPAHRRGIGRRLIAEMSRLCAAPLELKCQTNNRAAIAFYRRLGFRPGDAPGDSGVSDIGPWVRFRAPSKG